ncbi:MAG: preprotein translocase subunit SecA [Flavobacteriales bacterium]|jgi:preprotein translocase subunit SecA
MLNSLTGLIKKLVGDKNERDIKEIMPLVEETKVAFAGLANKSNDELRALSAQLKTEIAEYLAEDEKKIDDLKGQVEANPKMDIEEKEAIFEQVDLITKEIDEKLEVILIKILPQAFAIVKETAKRFVENSTIEVSASEFDRTLATTKDFVSINGENAIWSNTWSAAGSTIVWDMVHYDVQLIGGIALHKGRVAEMQTGEGKTLVSTLPVFLNALAGRGVHLVTVNDYLAKRDAEWMAPIHMFHGLTVDCIDNYQPNSDERRQAYLADITYGTNNEFGFDYLRDNMSTSPDSLVQRKHHFAIVDEVDSVLIDEARTPLIISGPTPRGDKHEFDELKPRVEKLYNNQRTLVTGFLAEAKKLLKGHNDGNVSKQDMTAGSLALFRCYRGLPKSKALIKFTSEPGVKAILQKTENYYLQEQSKHMPEADEPLFFTIDEKNNSIELTDKGVDLISGSGETSFFVLPDVAAAVGEIEKSEQSDEGKITAKDELLRDYSVKAERIHTVNQLLKAYTLFEIDVEYVVMDAKVKIVDEQTGRIMDGRRYSDGLHQAIESKENVRIEDASQTYATVTLQNYFRMYHKLAGMTGTAETEAGELWDIYKLDVMIIPTNRPVVRDDRQDKVYKTKREKYNAVIDEIIGFREKGQPVLVGTTSVEVSELLSKMLKLRSIQHNVLNAKLHQREADIVAEAGHSKMVTIATNMAGRGTDIKLSAEVKSAGGLAIIGTERHDSRRVDRQLRGRAGRQGDPGTSQFFVSLEDDLMRLFGSDRIAKMMDRLGLEEGEVIQHGMITKSIERAQKKVEENNFGVRKKLLEYDDVMNAQREVIYKRRRHALYGERLKLDIANMFFETAENISEGAQAAKDFDGFEMELVRVFSIASPVTEQEFSSMNPSLLANKVFEAALQHYSTKSKRIAEMALPVVKKVHSEQGETYENMVIPFSDGHKTLQIIANLKKCIDSEGIEIATSVEKSVVLAIIDNQWKEHLREMDDLRQSVQSAVYEQKDPLLIYKFESFELFKKMINQVNNEVVSFLSKAMIPSQANVKATSSATARNEAPITVSKGDAGQISGSSERRPEQAPKIQPVRSEKTVGRNDPCPCGSGKKFKQCHGK